MNIVHIILSRGFAGSERSTAESCNAQAVDHNVTLIVRKDHRRGGVSIVDQIDSGVHLVEVPARIGTAKKIKQALNEARPDVIHCHLRRSVRIANAIPSNAVRLATLHIEINSPVFLNLDGLICNAQWQVDKVPSNYQGQVFKANNSIQPHRRLATAEIQSLRAGLGLRNGEILIGAVGRYHASKAWDVLIPAFREIANPELRLLFVGRGKEEEKLKRLAAGDNRIHFLGFRRDVKDLYQCFDMLVLPSRYEPLPRVMLEAMDAGTPVLASNIGGCKELIDAYGGRMFEVDNIASLSAELQSMIKGGLQRHRPDLEAHYLENANAAMLNFYQSLIDAKRSSA